MRGLKRYFDDLVVMEESEEKMGINSSASLEDEECDGAQDMELEPSFGSFSSSPLLHEEEKKMIKPMEVESSGESMFDLLPPEIRHEIFGQIRDFRTLIKALQVSKLWNTEVEEAWYKLCRKMLFTAEEENFWREKSGKSWKWIFKTKINLFKGPEPPKEGVGAFESEKGRFEGEWVDGKKTGWGLMTWKNGGFYRGSWKENSKEGFGFQQWGSGTKWTGDTYEGNWKKSHREGHGSYAWNTGDKYEGNWKEGRKEGKGVFHFAKSGNTYKGNYVDDARNGFGFFQWANGDTYSGDWKDGEKHGEGVYIWSTGDKYEGYWERSERSGKGSFYWKNNTEFQGNWNRNRMHGEGKYTWNDGDYFIGVWVNNCRTGNGVLHMKDEKGEWKKIEQVWNEKGKTVEELCSTTDQVQAIQIAKADIRSLFQLEKFPTPENSE